MYRSMISSAERPIVRRVTPVRPMSIPYLDGIVFLLLPALVNLPAVPHLSLPRSFVSVLFFLLLLKNVFVYSAISYDWARSVNTAFKNVFTLKNRTLILLFTSLLLFIGSEMRSGIGGVISPFGFLGTFFWHFSILFYFLSVVALNRSTEARRFLLVSLVCGFGIFVAINVIAYYLGLRGFNSIDDAGQNKMLSLIGISRTRVALPFASGINNFGAMAGLVVVSGFCTAKYSRGVILFCVGSIVAVLGFIGIVLVDSRASAGVAVLVCVLMTSVGRLSLFSKFIKVLPLVVLVAPIIIYNANAVMRDTGLAGAATRQGAFAQRLGLLSGRDVVWNSAYRVFAEPEPIQLVGYGALGQYKSGAAKGYAWIFMENSGVTSHSLHNTFLQVLIDLGYIGLIVWILFWLSFCSDLVKKWRSGIRDLENSIPIAIALFISIGGIMEISGTPAYPDVFCMLMLVVALKLPNPDEKDK